MDGNLQDLLVALGYDSNASSDDSDSSNNDEETDLLKTLQNATEMTTIAMLFWRKWQ